MSRFPRLTLFITPDSYFCVHWLGLAMAARDAGYDVSVITRTQDQGDRIKNAGLRLIPLNISRSSANPPLESRVIRKLISIYRDTRPDIVHHVALKPILYGTIAARTARVPCIVNALAGLGYLFISHSLKARVVRPAIKLSFRLLLNRRGSRVVFQNPDDLELLCKERVLSRDRVALIPGVGVDTERFAVRPESPGPPVVVLASRMLWDKGVREFVEAAHILRQQGVSARFVLVGEGDRENPSSIPDAQLRAWHEEGVIEWWGRRDDMPTVLAHSHIACLPSYREGLPTALTEAAAIGRPIVTTDAPGCREVVRDGENGILVPVRDAAAVALALKPLIASPALRRQMGHRGREIVEREFSLQKVVDETLALYAEMLQ